MYRRKPALLGTVAGVTNFSPTQITRVYDEDNGPAFALKEAQAISGPTVLSFKLPPKEVKACLHDAEIEALLRAYSGYISYYHEPDQGGRPFTAAEFIDAWRHIHDIAVRVGSKARFVLILTGYQFSTRLPIWYPGSEYVNVIAIDPYASWIGQSAETLVGPALDLIDSYGKPAAIAEIGCNFTDPAERARFVATLSAILHRVKFICWYNATAHGINYSITNNPAAMAAWQGLVN